MSLKHLSNALTHQRYVCHSCRHQAFVLRWQHSRQYSKGNFDSKIDTKTVQSLHSQIDALEQRELQGIFDVLTSKDANSLVTSRKAEPQSGSSPTVEASEDTREPKNKHPKPRVLRAARRRKALAAINRGEVPTPVGVLKEGQTFRKIAFEPKSGPAAPTAPKRSSDVKPDGASLSNSTQEQGAEALVSRARHGQSLSSALSSTLEEHEKASGDKKQPPQSSMTLKQAMKPSKIPQKSAKESKPTKESKPAKEPKEKKSAKEPRSATQSLKIHEVETRDLQITAIDIPQPDVPTLSYGLERVLFNPGVYQLQDPRTHVYNFDPYLKTIMPVEEFDFNALKEYVTSSKDTALSTIAKEHGKRYAGSTSSMTGMLSQFHYLLSQWRLINTEMLSSSFPVTWRTFTQLQRGPAAIFLKWQDGSYAIDADKEFDSANVLQLLGKSMEKLLTLKTKDYERYRKSSDDPVTEESKEEPEAFHYSTMGDFLMRSQLDAYDPRLPGTGMFDLKTRAVVSIRLDVQNFEELRGYEIRKVRGEFESFEREYYDMIRAAFLKYSLQVRMGRMDGIFVAFHNTARIFGFQYIPLEDMDLAIHGQSDLALGDQEFKASLKLLNVVLDEATQKFPEQVSYFNHQTAEFGKC
jgi:hypothetical protein